MKKSPGKLSAFFSASPLKLALTLLLILSLLANIGTLIFVELLNHSAEFDASLITYTRNKVCNSDYQVILDKLNLTSQPEKNKKFYAAFQCFRDYNTGTLLDINSVQPLK